MSYLNIDSLLSMVLVLIMFSIGATLHFADFRRIFSRPKSLGLGLALQMLFLPFMTYVVVSNLDLPPAFQMGFIIVALCPGGTTSNFISYLVNADVALSISLTTINSFLILLTIPLGVNLGLDFFYGNSAKVSLPIWDTIIQVFSIILLPAFLGLCFNHFRPALSLKIRTTLKYLNVILLAAVYSMKFFAPEDAGGAGLRFNDIMELLPPAMILQVGTMLIAYLLARKTIKDAKSSLTIGIEVGLQNTALALYIAAVLLSDTDMSKPALVYAMFSFFTTLIFSLLVYRFAIRKPSTTNGHE